MPMSLRTLHPTHDQLYQLTFSHLLTPLSVLCVLNVDRTEAITHSQSTQRM